MAIMETNTVPVSAGESDALEFTAWATSPAAWFARAEQLQQSSELLWSVLGRLFDTEPQPDRVDLAAGAHAPAFMLVAGFAIEAMLKAAAIQIELNAGGVERVVVPGSSPSLRQWVKTHNLEKLAARAGIAFTDDSLIYLYRFKRYVLWAGRYPVPAAVPDVAEPRGFDYQVGVQDRRQFQEIYGLARTAYLRARDAECAWKEPTSLGDYRHREAVWMATCTEWLRVVRPALVSHAKQVAAGDRGVLTVNVDVEQMRAQLSAPKVIVTIVPTWLPADEFVNIMGARAGVGADTARRWAAQLSVMDASQDVALFIHSTPDSDGRWFSRHIFLKADGVG